MTLSAWLAGSLALTATLSAQTPVVADGGVLNAASFAKDSSGHGTPVAPGSLVDIFGAAQGAFSGALAAHADTVPLSTTLGNVNSVTFNNIQAYLFSTAPDGPFPFISAQIPFEALPPGQTSATMNVVVTINGVSSAPKSLTVIPAAPGIYTIPPDGVSNALLAFLDPADGVAKFAAPTSLSIGYPTAPIPRGYGGGQGQVAFVYANGLGNRTPSVADGDGGENLGTASQANQTPIVWVGGVNKGMTAQVLFAGQAFGFPTVDQINIAIPTNAPAGDGIVLQLQTADGSVVSNQAKISIR